MIALSRSHRGVETSGALSSRFTSSSQREGVFPWLAPAVLRFTPATGLSATAFRLQR